MQNALIDRQAARVYRTKEASNNISNRPGGTIDIPQSSELEKTSFSPLSIVRCDIDHFTEKLMLCSR